MDIKSAKCLHNNFLAVLRSLPFIYEECSSWVGLMDDANVMLNRLTISFQCLLQHIKIQKYTAPPDNIRGLSEDQCMSESSCTEPLKELGYLALDDLKVLIFDIFFSMFTCLFFFFPHSDFYCCFTWLRDHT